MCSLLEVFCTQLYKQNDLALLRLSLPKRFQVTIIQRHKLDLLGIPKLIRLVQIVLRGIQLGGVARQIVLNRTIGWKQLGGFQQ